MIIYPSWPTGFYSEEENMSEFLCDPLNSQGNTTKHCCMSVDKAKKVLGMKYQIEEKRYAVIWHCPYNGTQTFKVEPGILHLITALCVANKDGKRSSYESAEISNTIPGVGKVEFLPESYANELENHSKQDIEDTANFFKGDK